MELEVKLDSFATEDEVAAVAAALAACGLDAEVAGEYKKFRYGELTGEADEPEWIIVLILSSTFGAFFSGVFGQAGSDSWKKLKSMIKDLRDSRRKPTGPVIPPSPPHVGSVYIRDMYGNELGFGVYPKMVDDDFWKAWETIHEPDWSALGGWHVTRANGQWIAAEPLPGKGRVVRWDRARERWVPTRTGDGLPPSNTRGLRKMFRWFFSR